MNITSGKSNDVSRRPVRRGVPDLVVAQLLGVVGGLKLAVDGLVAPTPKRYTIVDRDLTRC
jgi:hypothetical protein